MGVSRDPLDARDDLARSDRYADTGASARRDDISDEQNTGLRALSDLDDLGIADGEPDIRGWTVRTADGADIGEVDDLIVDTAAMKVRYMCVELDKDAFDLDDDRRVLVPLGTARLHDEDDNVFITATPSQLLALPIYDDDAFKNNDRDSHELFGRPWMTGQTASPEENRINTLDRGELYAQEQYNDRQFFGARRRDREDQSYLRRHEEELRLGTREVEQGEVAIHKRVETEHVSERVPVRREEVEIERRPIRADAATDDEDARIGEEEIRIPLRAEEVVAERRIVPKEEVVIRKKIVEDEQTIEADLRRERIDVDDAARTQRSARDRDERDELR